jgi:hypothetical protein
MFNILYHIILYIEHNYQTSRSTSSIKLVIFDPSHTSHVHNVGLPVLRQRCQASPKCLNERRGDDDVSSWSNKKNPKMSMVIWLVGGVQIFVMILNDDLVGVV